MSSQLVSEKIELAEIQEDTRTSAWNSPSLQTIRRVSLKDRAAQQIREAIEHGELKAGTVLTELGLAKKLGVGQPTIREALLELMFLGFVERHGPRKTRVTLLTRSMIDEIYVVRVRLECLAAELVAAQEHPDLRQCWKEVQHLEDAAKTGQAIKFYQADLAFHRALWKATGNDSLRSCLEQLVPRLMTFSIIQRVHPPTEKLLAIALVHRELLEVIEARDRNLEAVRSVMQRSMENAWLDDTQLPELTSPDA
jgi:DNA-binding GntR family transcriptional regulator